MRPLRHTRLHLGPSPATMGADISLRCGKKAAQQSSIPDNIILRSAECALPTRQEIIDRNFEAFQKELPALLATHRDKYALLHDEKVVEFFDSVRDALIYGRDHYPNEDYSVQKVTDASEDLGYFSHALYQPVL